jgi:DNA repair protein SbcD/Mre11
MRPLKILHTADWHLGKRLGGFSRHAEQLEVMEEICGIADRENPDLVLVAGDLFDVFNPPTESIDLLYKTLKRLSNNGLRPVVAIAGNHDSPERINAPNPLAKACGIIFSGLPFDQIPAYELQPGFRISQSDTGFIELKLDNYPHPIRIIMTAYANEIRVKQFLGTENEADKLNLLLANHWSKLADKYCDNKGINLMVAHLLFVRDEKEEVEETDGEKSISIGGAGNIYKDNLPHQLNYVALGHLHSQHKVASSPCPIVYSGSPIAYSFQEVNQDKYLVMVEAELGKPAKFDKLALSKGKRLLRAEFENVDEALVWLEAHQNDLVEITVFSDTYLSSSDTKRLHSKHENILTIVPKLKIDAASSQKSSTIDLNKDIQSLFVDYFKQKHNGQEPNEEILNLFKEVVSND